jgi:hypothetical protein
MCSPSPSPTPTAPHRPSHPRPKPQTFRRNVANPPATIGINLEGLTDWERSFMFIDAMRTARKFGVPSAAHGENAPLDANGWPTADAGTLVMTEVKNINGTYKFSAVGQCELTAVPGQVRNYRYDERSNRCFADVVVNQPKDQEVTLILLFKNTFGGLKNIKLLRPGYDSDAEIFTNQFKRAIAPLRRHPLHGLSLHQQLHDQDLGRSRQAHRRHLHHQGRPPTSTPSN